jgi:predicted phage tail protein
MKKFIFHGDLSSRFCNEIDLDVLSIREFIEALSNLYPNFRSYYVNKTTAGIDHLFINSKKTTYDMSCIDIILKDDTYNVVPHLKGSAGAGDLGGTLSSMGGGFLQSAIMGYGMQKLSDAMSDDSGTTEYEIIETNSYIYTSNDNRMEQGSPVPVIYGQLRVGSKIINAAVENYDLDYESSTIYEQPDSEVDMRKIVDDAGAFGRHSFIRTTNFQEGQEVGSYDSSDSSKIILNIPANGTTAKDFNSALENESFNSIYASDPSAGGERVVSGPSVGSPNVPSADSTTVPSRENPRPYVFPPNGSLASFLRPSSSSDLCVERVAHESNTDDTALAYTSTTSEMKVGTRGSYQKLESLSMYKSLELISEGPIAGLAFPVDGFEQDSGFITYPLGANAVPAGDSKFRLGSLSYIDSVSHFTAVGAADSTTINIENAGNNPAIPNGTFNIICNGSINRNLGFGIQATKPASTSSASIDVSVFPAKKDGVDNETLYYDNTLTTNEHIISSNGLFLLRKSDGSIRPNTNTDAAIFRSLNAQYTQTESIGGTNYTVFNLTNLSTDAGTLKSNFSTGEGYRRERNDFIISPDAAFPELDIQRIKALSSGRSQRATCLDLRLLLGSTGSPDVLDGLINDLHSSTSTNVPNSTTPWSSMCRIQLDSTNSTIANNLASANWVRVCTYQGSQRVNRVTRAISGDGYIRISVQDFITGRNINGTNIRTSTGEALPGFGHTFTPVYNAPYTDFSTGQDGNHFQDLITNQANLGVLCGASAAFNNSVWNRLSGFFGGHNGTVTSRGQRVFKFVPGSGNPRNGNAKLNNTFTQSIVDGGFNNLDSVTVVDAGINGEDDSSSPKGFYCPLIFPRVTVMILRKSALGFGGNYLYSWMPTRIEAVAEVDGNGTVNNIHLLDVPDEPVWDTTESKYTEIFPQDIASGRQSDYGSSGSIYNYQDIGFYLKVDASNANKNIEFEVNQNGTVSSSFTNANKNHALQKVYPTWDEHIRRNTPDENSEFEEGLVFDTINSTTAPTTASKLIPITDVPNSLNKPTTEAQFRVNLEIINLAGKRKTTLNNGADVTCSRITTGRASSITLANAGAGYTPKTGTSAPGFTLSAKLYNYTWTISSVLLTSTAEQSNAGFEPDSSFIVYGISSFIVNATWYNNLSDVEKSMFCNFKAQVNVGSQGKIQDIQVLDGGSHFFDGSDIVFLDSSNRIYATGDWANALYDARSAAISTQGTTQNSIGSDNESFKINPTGSLPKRDMIISYEANHVVHGKITKFYIRDFGLGFLPNQVIQNPFANVSFVPPTITLTFANGTLNAASILRTSNVSGYTVNDNNVSLKVASSAPARTTAAPPNDITEDPSAMFRSIYLNDVPIKDANDRFNYTKFHFDMRIGNSRNGNPSSTHIDPTRLAADARGHMITDEFKVPAHTKFIEYPLYGPNNQDTRDYFYTHTVKNPEITSVGIAIKINKLHYVYEGDEESVFINFLPMLGALGGYIVGTSAAKSIIAKLSGEDPTKTSGSGKGTVGPCGGAVTTMTSSAGTTKPAASTALEKAANAAQYAAIAGGGFLGSLAGMMVAQTFPCSKIPWLCIKVGALIKNSGEIWPAKIRIGIEYGAEGQALQEDIIEIRGCATSPYVKDVYLHNLPMAEVGTNAQNKRNRIIKIYRYTREMNPVVGGLAEARYQIDAELLSITEYVGGFFAYPNSAIIGTRVNSKDHPSVPTREYLIKGRLLKVPSNYFPEQPFDPNSKTGLTSEAINAFRYTPDIWDGTFRTEADARWTSNPAWIIYDLLTNKRYGMGKYGIKEEDIDKWSFYDFARYCDEEVDVFIDGTASTERRHMCNLYIDGEREAYDYIKELMSIYSSTFSFSSGKIYITVDKPNSDAVMLFNNSNVSEEGFSYSTTPETQRITACTVDYVDERDNYMIKTEYVEDAEGIRQYGYNHIKIAGQGITRLGEAHRLCWQKILTRQLEKEMIQFKSGIQAAYLRVGDVIDVMDNNKISKHSGGRIAKIISNNTIEIDVPSSAISGTTRIFLQKAFDSDEMSDTSDSSQIDDRRSSQFEEFVITGTNGFEVTIDGDLTGIEKGFTWMIKEDSDENIKPKKFRVKSLKEVGKLSYEIVGTEYVAEKYEQVSASSSSRDGINFEEREYYGPEIIVP